MSPLRLCFLGFTRKIRIFSECLPSMMSGFPHLSRPLPSQVLSAIRGMLVLAVLSLAVAGSVVSATEIVPADVNTIIDTRAGQLAIWRLADNQNVLIFDFPDLNEQGRTFNRITHLIEQFNEPYKRVMGSEEFAQYLDAMRRSNADFAFGHDILASEFTQFFNLADRDKIELSPEETALRDFLIEQGILKSWRGIYQTAQGNTVVLAIPQAHERRENEPPITALARRAIVLHEVAHGEYYTNKYYADYCRKFWSSKLNDDQREHFKRFLSNYNYAPNADELLVNEMQAYLMFTPDPSSFSAAKLGVSQVELDSMRAAFASGKPPTRLPISKEGAHK